MANNLLAKVGASIVTTVAGGTAWLVIEPGMQTRLARWTGLSVPAAETVDSNGSDLTFRRHPDADPSFSCDDASTSVEKLICADPAIAEADRALNRVWATLRQRDLIDDTLRLSQRQWLARRDACLIDEDPRACVADAMLTRISELSAL